MVTNTLSFCGGEKWLVMDLYRFLHYFNVFYNRLYVLYKYPDTGYERLRSYLDESLYQVDTKELLYIDSLIIKSPFKIELSGLADILEQAREFYKDIKYRNKLEKEKMKHEVAIVETKIAERQQDIREKEVDIKYKETVLVSRQIKLLKENGYTQTQIYEIINKLIKPAKKLITVGEKNDVEVLENDESNQD